MRRSIASRGEGEPSQRRAGSPYVVSPAATWGGRARWNRQLSAADASGAWMRSTAGCGVAESLCGYAGGHAENPTYEQVCGKRTGHAEVVQLRFDPAVVSYADILRVFFTIHDPTTKDRQGADIGPQYRSVIFFHSPEQEATARAVMAAPPAGGLPPSSPTCCPPRVSGRPS